MAVPTAASSSCSSRREDSSLLIHSTTSSPRLTKWVSFFFISVVILGATIEACNNAPATNEIDAKYNRWSLALASINFSLACISIILHTFSQFAFLIIGTKFEGTLSLLILIFSVAKVSVVTDPKHGLAVNEVDGAVSNGNLYYFTWGGLIMSVVLFTAYLRDALDVDVTQSLRYRSNRLNLWSSFVSSACVVMTSMSKIFHHSCVANGEEELLVSTKYCRRTVFGIVLGTISTAFSFYVVLVKIATKKSFFVVEALFSGVMVLLYGIGVSLLTADGAPAAPLGNAYYFTWLSFFVSFMLCSSLYEDYHKMKFSYTTHSQHNLPQNLTEEEREGEGGGVVVGGGGGAPPV